VTPGVGVLDVGVFDEAPSKDEIEFDELGVSGFGAVGLVEACFDGGCNPLTVLSPVPDLDLSAGAVGDVTGAGVQLGASSGIKGAVAGAGAGSSARREAAEPNKARARPPASAHQRARDARTVDASTGKKSIEFGPAFPDALRDTSRLSKFTKQRHEGDGDLGRKDRSRNAARIGSAGKVFEIEWLRAGGERKDWRGAYKYFAPRNLSRWSAALEPLHKEPRTQVSRVFPRFCSNQVVRRFTARAANTSGRGYSLTGTPRCCNS